MKIEMMPIKSIKPYDKNPRKNDKAIPQVIKSIEEFGWRQPIVVDNEMVVIVGHTRLAAAKKMKLKLVPVHVADLTEAQVRAYRITDNRSHDRSKWDMPLLSCELDAVFDMDAKFDLEFMDFSLEDLTDENETANPDPKSDNDSNYSRKINAPIYIPTGEKPALTELVNFDHTKKLLAEIEKSDVPEDIKEFLRHSAARHSVFNFQRIAEYYAHAPKNLQGLMENSALVIIDLEKAIEQGYIRMTNDIANVYAGERTSDEDE